jgi:3-dehydroquinate synthetase
MAGDKKNMDGRLALILLRGIGKAFLEMNVDARRLTGFLDRDG